MKDVFPPRTVSTAVFLAATISLADAANGLRVFPGTFASVGTLAAGVLTTFVVFFLAHLGLGLTVRIVAGGPGRSSAFAPAAAAGLAAMYAGASLGQTWAVGAGAGALLGLTSPFYLLFLPVAGLVGVVVYSVLDKAAARGGRRGRWPAARVFKALPGILGLLVVALWVGARAQSDPEPGIAPLPTISRDGSAPERVILLSVDTLRPDYLSSYDDSGVATPHIDALAADGILFREAMSPAPWTKPAFASIMTGLPVSVHRVLRHESRLSPRLRTLAEVLRSAGYRTSAIVRNPWLEPGSNIGKGFDEYDQVGLTTSRHGGSFGNWLFSRLSFVFHHRDLAWPLLRDDDKAWTARLTAMATEWVGENGDEPFFLWLHYFDPHSPFGPPARYLPARKPPPRMGTAFYGGPSVRDGSYDPTPRERLWIRDLYGGEVRHVDENIGELVALLKRRGLYENSLIVFVSDHGEEFWEHGRFEHGHSLYRELLHVPLIIKPHGGGAPGEIVDRVSTDRLLATILDLCRIDPPDTAGVGPSLAGLWSNEHQPAPLRPVFSSGLIFYEDQESVIFDGVKYCRSRHSRVEEFFDLDEDPGERLSLVGTRNAEVARARRLLDSHRTRTAELRRHYGLAHEAYEMDSRTRARLRSLGYVN